MKGALLGLFASTAMALGMAGTDQLVGEYEPIKERPGWPEGIHAMLLDPARKVGWTSWFSELPNDCEQYAFAVRTTGDAQRLINALAKVAGPKRRVTFNPGRGPRGLGDFRPAAKGREWGAVLRFSNSNTVAQWKAANAGRDAKLGALLEAPTVLEIFLGTANVDPLALKIPAELTVGTMDQSPFPGRDYPAQVQKVKDLKARLDRK